MTVIPELSAQTSHMGSHIGIPAGIQGSWNPDIMPGIRIYQGTQDSGQSGLPDSHQSPHHTCVVAAYNI